MATWLGLHRRRGGPRAPSAPLDPEALRRRGAAWCCGCWTGWPSARRWSCCWRTCTGPTPPAWTRSRRWPQAPGGRPAAGPRHRPAGPAGAAADLGAQRRRCTPGCGLDPLLGRRGRAAWWPRSCSGPTTCRRPWSTSSSTPPTATRSTSRNWSSGSSRRASSTPRPNAGGCSPRAIATGPRAHDAARPAAGPARLAGGLRARTSSAVPPWSGGCSGTRRWHGWPPSIARRRGDSALDQLAAHEVVFPAARTPPSPAARSSPSGTPCMRDVAYEGVLRSVRRRAPRAWPRVAGGGRRAQPATGRARRRRRPPPRGGRAPAAAARWYLRAGQHAAGTFASDDALRLLARAESLVPRASRDLWCDVLLAREAVLDRMGRREEQRATLDQLAPRTDLDPGRRRRSGSPRRAGCSSAATTPPSRRSPRRRPTSRRRAAGPTWSRRPHAGRPEPRLPQRARRRRASC